MLREQETKEKYGYEIKELSPSSSALVCWQCDRCTFNNEYTYIYYLQKKEKAKSREGIELCQTCGHSHLRGKVKPPKENNSKSPPLPPEVDIEKTISKFGYSPNDILPWSRKRVIVKCYNTQKEFEVRRCDLNNNKSVIETGHYLSTGAYLSKRRSGKRASEETKKRMKESQQKRRELAKVESEKQANTKKEIEELGRFLRSKINIAV